LYRNGRIIIKTSVFVYGAICPGGGKMTERIVLSNSDFLRVLDSIDFESGLSQEK